MKQIERLEIDSHTSGQLKFYKSVEAVQWRKESFATTGA